MSAICGIINFSGGTISTDISSEMMIKLKRYPFDDFGSYNKGQAFLGNIHKYTTNESKLERLPFIHKATGLVIVADAIIDNRKELYREFNVKASEGCKISDSELIIMAYLKWGQECPKYLVGDFAFVIWNEKRKEIFCARDHVGRKTFYYYFSSGIFAFCTVIKPLLHVKKDPNALNDSWIANFLALQGPIHEINCNDTIYGEIQQLLPANFMKLSVVEMIKKQYWFPLKVKPLKLSNNKEYEEAFMEVFEEAVNCRLRSVGSVGIMLSGGLDSGSIACLAARELNKEGLRLKAFSSVPMAAYNDGLPNYLLADESEYIRAIVEAFNNVDINFCACEGMNSYDCIDELINIMEQPYKFVQNSFWINEISSKAAKEGCSILLSGEFGNYTISFGDIVRYLITLYRSGRWISFIKTIKEYSDFHNVSYKRVIKDFLKIVLPKKLLNGKSFYDRVDESIVVVNPEYSLNWNTDGAFRKAVIGPYLKYEEDLYKVREESVRPVLFSQMGSADTKLSLHYGVEKRDPTRDKRIIEFCMSLPLSQYVNHGVERSLIRRSMNGILPDKVRLNFDVRGSQGADWIQRILPYRDNIGNEIEKIVHQDNLRKFIDLEKLKAFYEGVGDIPKNKDNQYLQALVISIVFQRFLKDLKAD